MKKLIDAAAVAALKSQGETVIFTDRNTLVTPSARDLAAAEGMEIKENCCQEMKKTDMREETEDGSGYSPRENTPGRQTGSGESGKVDSELIFRVLSRLQDAGLLRSMLTACEKGLPYAAEYDPAGFKLIRGESVQKENLETDHPEQRGKVRYREIIGADDGSSMAAGMITMEDVTFDWVTECQEIYCITEGCIRVTIADRVYDARPGDAFFIKKGVSCTFGSKETGSAFYVTYGS